MNRVGNVKLVVVGVSEEKELFILDEGEESSVYRN
jgi:hypothetical protein